MRVFWVLFKKELRAFFVSPMAYIVLALVMVLNGFSFRAALSVRSMVSGSVAIKPLPILLVTPERRARSRTRP